MSERDSADQPNTPRPCDCTHTLSLFCASLIPQPWMQSAAHCPAVRCRCGKQYFSLSQNRAFASATADDGRMDEFAGSNEVTRAYSAPEEDRPLLPPWEKDT